jgi:DNA polymerase-4
MPSKKIVLHIDFDSYFASCEQQFNPKLRGKPIGVTAQNGRTCIIAASREAKKMGIKSPSRTWEAIKIVPSMIFVPAQFEKYWEITQKFLNICKDFSPFVELFSLDEVFIDITSTQELFGGKYQIINKIKKRIENEIGEYITVSVGISHNKLLAKLASGINKPNGTLEISPQNIWQIYAKVQLTDFCGIGRRIEKRLNRLRIYTPLDLHNVSLAVLIREFKDVEGHFLKNLGNGEDDSVVIPYYTFMETKSVGRSYCLPQNTYDQRLILQNIYELCEEISLKLRRLDKKGRTVFLYLGGNRSAHGRKTIIDYIDSAAEIFTICQLLYQEWEWDKASDSEQKMVRQISISVGNLQDCKNLTLSMFENDDKKAKVSKTVDKINEKFGDHTVRNGFLLYGPNLKTVPNGFMADRFERKKLEFLSVD